jgi:hypothetical protein
MFCLVSIEMDFDTLAQTGYAGCHFSRERHVL